MNTVSLVTNYVYLPNLLLFKGCFGGQWGQWQCPKCFCWTETATHWWSGIQIHRPIVVLTVMPKRIFFKCSLPQQPFWGFFCHWSERMAKKKQKGRLFQGLQWTNVIATGIKSVHPFCILVFKRQSIKTSQSRTKAPVFSCTAYCRIQDCPVTMGNNEKTLKCFPRRWDVPQHKRTENKMRCVESPEMS